MSRLPRPVRYPDGDSRCGARCGIAIPRHGTRPSRSVALDRGWSARWDVWCAAGVAHLAWVPGQTRDAPQACGNAAPACPEHVRYDGFTDDGDGAGEPGAYTAARLL